MSALQKAPYIPLLLDLFEAYVFDVTYDGATSNAFLIGSSVVTYLSFAFEDAFLYDALLCNLV
jgi:hypothetical protein